MSMDQETLASKSSAPENTSAQAPTRQLSSSSTASIIHLANISAQYGSSIFADSEACAGANAPSSAPYSNAVNSTTTPYSAAIANPPAVLPEKSRATSSPSSESVTGSDKPRKKCCHNKQHQLPMFLSKTYHMIDRCDQSIASWSDNGDNFVVKNVERFASHVLPQYFKHSNFSSFARQLNFYGFRKLKAEPILTADFDARTADHVRFYHENFQRNKPDLLTNIKRATKSDAQSKDDVDGLRAEISQLKECMRRIRAEYDTKLANLAFEFNRKFATLSAEYERMTNSMQRPVVPPMHSTAIPVAGDMQSQQPAHAHASQYHSSLQSLTHVAGVKLQSPSVSSQPAIDKPAPPPLVIMSTNSNLDAALSRSATTTTAPPPTKGEKRRAEDDLHNSSSRSVHQRTSA